MTQKILNQRLLEHVTSLNILHKSQIVCLPAKNRTSDHLLTLRTLIDSTYTITVKKYTLVLLTLEN